MDIQGYAQIVKEPVSKTYSISLIHFANKIVKVIEFGYLDSVIVVCEIPHGLAIFEKEDIHSSFRCQEKGNVLIPSGLSERDSMLHYSMVINRLGGYNSQFKNKVINLSLAKGKLTDDFLFLEKDKSK